MEVNIQEKYGHWSLFQFRSPYPNFPSFGSRLPKIKSDADFQNFINRRPYQIGCRLSVKVEVSVQIKFYADFQIKQKFAID